MAWEKRGNQRYYYHKRRVNGRVVSEYISNGVIADLAEERKANQAAKREQERKERARVDTLEEQLNQLEETTAAIVRAALLAANYHDHKGQWRRVRCQKAK
jgi:hypothetical protein